MTTAFSLTRRSLLATTGVATIAAVPEVATAESWNGRDRHVTVQGFESATPGIYQAAGHSIVGAGKSIVIPAGIRLFVPKLDARYYPQGFPADIQSSINGSTTVVPGKGLVGDKLASGWNAKGEAVIALVPLISWPANRGLQEPGYRALAARRDAMEQAGFFYMLPPEAQSTFQQYGLRPTPAVPAPQGLVVGSQEVPTRRSLFALTPNATGPVFTG